MTKKELQLLFDLAKKLYIQEQKKSGMTTPIPYAWAKNGEEMFLAISIYGVHSDTVKNKLKEII